MKNSRRGFTLIEILVVIGIMAILAAVVLVAINPARQFAQANDAQRSANLNAILNAIGQYAVDHKGQLPPGITTSLEEINSELCGYLVPTYLSALPTDPLSDFGGKALASSTPSSNDLECSDIVITTRPTLYQVTKDSFGRVTLDAPKAEIASTTVTR